MKFLKSLGLLLSAASAYAGAVNFRVICVNCKEVNVIVNGKEYPLNKYNELPYFMNGVEAKKGDKYHYVADGVAEEFEREFDGELEDRTYNDFFQRQITVKKLYQFGFPLPDEKKWKRSIGKQELFDDTYIPTIYVEGGLNFFQTAPKGTTTVQRVTFFLKDNVHYYTNVPLSCKNRNNDKFQVRFGLPPDANNKNPLKRSILKLRASSEDPAFMRQLIYSDILHAIGNPTHESVTCRVYSDGVGIGVYVLQEDVTTKSFARAAFYGDEKTGKISISTDELGSPLDCSTGADFQLDNDYNSFQPLENNTNEKIVQLIEAMNKVDPTNKSDLENFSQKWFDLDVFFRALAVEYLAGHWDSYWYYTTNYVMYDDPRESSSSNVKYYFVDQDFDLTWGCGLSDEINRYGQEYPSHSYKEDVNRVWNIGGNDGPNRYAIDKFLSDGTLTKGMFEAYLVSIVKHVFNPVAMRAKVDAYAERIRPELVWEYSTPRQYSSLNSKKYDFNIEDFDTGIEKGGRRHAWGIMDWTQTRADAVAKEFGFEYDTYPITPADAEKIKVSPVQPMEASGNYEEYAGQKVTQQLASDSESSDAINLSVITKSFIIVVAIYLLL